MCVRAVFESRAGWQVFAVKLENLSHHTFYVPGTRRAYLYLVVLAPSQNEKLREKKVEKRVKNCDCLTILYLYDRSRTNIRQGSC